MAGIEQPQYTVNVSQQNLISKFAVQGEENSRVLTLHLVENVDTEDAFNQTEIRQKPLDLTGCTARLYVKKPDGNAVFMDGAIVATGADGEPNTVTFVLTQQTLAAAGNARCTVAIFGEGGTELKATGITLDIEADDMEQTIVSTSEFVSLAEALENAKSAEKIATDSAAEIDKTVSAANTELSSLKTQASDIATAESARVTAEAGRCDEESQRASNESARKSAESTRQTQESTRQSNESSRVSAETSRATAETARQTAEGKRVTAESGRTDAESRRVAAESDRASAEAARNTAESARQAAEGKREQNAQAMAAATTTANTAADKANTAASNADTAADKATTSAGAADTAATRANAAAQAAEDAVSGDIGTAVDQRIAAKTDVAGGIAGYDSTQTALGKKADKSDIPTTAAQVHARADTWMPTAADVGAAPSSHTSETVSTESGVHGLRYYSEKLQAKDANGDWQDITTGSSGFAPKDVSGLSASAGNTQVTILWSDPPDSVVDGTTISKWAGSKLVRKEGSYPTAPTDGTLLIDNTVRDKYKTVGYADTGLTNGTAYYYAVFPYSDTGAVNKDEANQISATPRASATYGVIWHETLSSPVLERIDDSASFTATATDGSTAGHSDFDDKPIYKDIKICNVVNRQVVAYEGDATFKRDGSNGDVMVEIPKFYYKVTDNGTDRTYEISDIQLDGFLVAPRHAPCEDYPNGLDKIYVGVYEASSGFKSISGQAPLVSLTRAQFRAGFANRGAGYCQADWATQFELQALYAAEMAHLNSQATVGNGNTSTSAAINTGGSDSVAGMTGCANKASQSTAVKYRGIENLWGNVNEWRDGINFNDGLIYVCTDPSKYADDTATNCTKLAYSKIQNNGYIHSLGLDANVLWAQVPTAVDGSSSTYLCDYYYSNSGWRVPCVGGSWSAGSSAGLFSLHSYYFSSYYYSHIGSRLLVLPQ